MRIPFSLAEYARLPYAWEGLPEDQYHHAPAFLDLPLSRRAVAVEWCLRERNRYVTNLNGARNVALAEGRAVARWVLPLDGQLFLTADAWAAIRAAAAAPGDARYLIVPMARLLDDAVVLRGGPPPAADHEPSIAFTRPVLDRSYTTNRDTTVSDGSTQSPSHTGRSLMSLDRGFPTRRSCGRWRTRTDG